MMGSNVADSSNGYSEQTNRDSPGARTMRFSENGYYIERYVKCDNCGVLIYGEGIRETPDEDATIFCSPWCQEWKAQRTEGVESPAIGLDF